jgi:hypothetical protein
LVLVLTSCFEVYKFGFVETKVPLAVIECLVASTVFVG